MKLAATIAFGLLMPLPCKADDEMYKAYVLSLFSKPGKALSELETLAASRPLLISYALALFTEKGCGTPEALNNAHKRRQAVMALSPPKRARRFSRLLASLRR